MYADAIAAGSRHNFPPMRLEIGIIVKPTRTCLRADALRPAPAGRSDDAEGPDEGQFEDHVNWLPFYVHDALKTCERGAASTRTPSRGPRGKVRHRGRDGETTADPRRAHVRMGRMGWCAIGFASSERGRSRRSMRAGTSARNERSLSGLRMSHEKHSKPSPGSFPSTGHSPTTARCSTR